MKYYTGVGSREAPAHICAMFTSIAMKLADQDWTLRSGHAGEDEMCSADLAFEAGADLKEIYLPNRGFNRSTSILYGATPAAYEIARTIHPAWAALSPFERLLHARNCHQVLGRDLKTPSSFLLCYTDQGFLQGGTRTAIVLAQRNRIPVLNAGELKYCRKTGGLDAYILEVEKLSSL